MATTHVSQDFRLYDSTEVWDQEMQPGQRNLLRALIDFWPRDAGGAVDVGCGDGKLTQRLAVETGIPILGFDSSAEALSRVALPTVQGDAADMPFEDASYDLVLSTDTLEHISTDTHDRVWSEIFRVARRHVMVAVPFREELLDATARCHQCGGTYHVNWHQRAYDIADLLRRAPPGWLVNAIVVSGEAWSETLPAETRVRRAGLDQWSGWSMAICPHCGATGREPSQPPPLSPLLATALGRQIYTALKEKRVWRSHSEILCVYGRDSSYVPPSLPRPVIRTSPASRAEPAGQEVHGHLVSYPQVARCVRSPDGEMIVQFPLYEATASLQLKRVAGTGGPVEGSLEDGFGVLYSGPMLETGQSEATIGLPRQPAPGQFGVLLRLKMPQLVESVQLGGSPRVSWASPEAATEVAYHRVLDDGAVPLWVQVTGRTWIDDGFWRAGVASDHALPALLEAMESVFGERIELLLKQLAETTHSLDAARVTTQNLQAAQEAMLPRLHEAERLAVDVQNLLAERDALRKRAAEADHLAVALQNLGAEREALRKRAAEADHLAVERQNLQAERDALQQRATEQERLAVAVQNLQAERQALLLRAREADRLAVDVQNLQAEREVLRERAREQERQAVELQNLQAERQALLLRAREADQLAVDVQNLQAENAALQQRQRDADRLALQLDEMQWARDEAAQRAESAEMLLAALRQVLGELQGRAEYRVGETLRRWLRKEDSESPRKKT